MRILAVFSCNKIAFERSFTTYLSMGDIKSNVAILFF